MQGLKDNTHRDLWNALTDGRITADEYHKRIEAHNKQSIHVMLRKNLAKKPGHNKK
jgi:hypothetical protein